MIKLNEIGFLSLAKWATVAMLFATLYNLSFGSLNENNSANLIIALAQTFYAMFAGFIAGMLISVIYNILGKAIGYISFDGKINHLETIDATNTKRGKIYIDKIDFVSFSVWFAIFYIVYFILSNLVLTIINMFDTGLIINVPHYSYLIAIVFLPLLYNPLIKLFGKFRISLKNNGKSDSESNGKSHFQSEVVVKKLNHFSIIKWSGIMVLTTSILVVLPYFSTMSIASEDFAEVINNYFINVLPTKIFGILMLTVSSFINVVVYNWLSNRLEYFNFRFVYHN